MHDVGWKLECLASVEGPGWLSCYLNHYLTFTDVADLGAGCLLPRLC